MHIAFNGGMRCRRGGSRSIWCGRCSFPNYHAWSSTRELLLQFENLLRKRVDFGVLFVNLFCQNRKLCGVTGFCLVRGGALCKSSAERKQAYCAEHAG